MQAQTSKKRGPEGWEAQNFAFFPLPPQCFLSSSLRCPFRPSKVTTKIPRKDPKREERKTIVVGEGKKSENLGGPAEEGPAEGRVRRGRGSAQILDAPTKILITHSTDTPHHTTTQRNATTTTQHTTQRWVPHREVLGREGGGGSCGEVLGGAGRSMAQKQDMSNKFRRAAPLAKVFWGQVRKGLGTKRFDQKKWSRPKVVRP